MISVLFCVYITIHYNCFKKMYYSSFPEGGKIGYFKDPRHLTKTMCKYNIGQLWWFPEGRGLEG